MDLDVNFEVDDKQQPSLLLAVTPCSTAFVVASLVSLEPVEFASARNDLHNVISAVHADDNVQVECVKPTPRVDLVLGDFQCDDRIHAHATLFRTDADSIDS